MILSKTGNTDNSQNTKQPPLTSGDYDYASPGVPTSPDDQNSPGYTFYDKDGRSYYMDDGERIYTDEQEQNEKENTEIFDKTEKTKSSVGLIFTGILVIATLYQMRKS